MPGLRADQIALYKKDMYAAERESYMETPTTYDKVFKVKPSATGAGDKSTQLLGLGSLDRHTVESQDIKFKSPVQGWEFLVRYWTYSSGLALSYEAVEDTVKLGNLLKDLAETWGKQNRIAKEQLGAQVFNDGGDLSGAWVFNGTHTGNNDASGNLLYDSKPLFNLIGNARSSKGGGTYYNSVAALAITPDNFVTLYTLHTETNAYDERDEVVENPCDTVLVKTATDEFAAKRIFNTPSSNGIPGSANNDLNPYFGLVDSVIKWRYLKDTSAPWYLGKRQSMDFQFHERQQPRIRFFRDENNLGYKASNVLRIGVLIKNWRTWSRGGGTSA